MTIQWYPGHMAKTKRLISEQLKLIDIVVELADARLPMSSRNPDIDALCASKPRIIALNKADMADDTVTKEWINWYQKQGISVVSICSITGTGLNKLKEEITKQLKEKKERDDARGMVGRSIKMMVVGIPNVGKSAFINKIAGRASATTGDRPGVTRTTQWIRIPGGYELLDTPGVLWPKFDDEKTALNLAYTGAIKDDVLDIEEIAMKLCVFLRAQYKAELCERYKLSDIDDLEEFELLETIARKRGCIISGGEVDTHRVAGIILDEFRGMKIGRISLERPDTNGGL